MEDLPPGVQTRAYRLVYTGHTCVVYFRRHDLNFAVFEARIVRDFHLAVGLRHGSPVHCW